jgi:DNA-binding response OmpR family regulator
MHVLKSDRNHRVDLVLTDVMMPLLDGFGLLKKIRSRAKTHTLPVIMLSARAGEDTGAEGLDEGADDYLSKPFTARQLLSRVASHIHLSRMRLRAARIEKQLRVKVKESKKMLEGVLASIQDAFLALDDRQRYTFVNVNAARLLEAEEEGNELSRTRHRSTLND